MNLIAPLNTDNLMTWLNYWGHVHVSGIDLGLERVLPVAEKLNILSPSAKVITVAGTNGKGSTTTAIAEILNEAGYRVALYQSPHIYRFNERIKISGQEATDHELITAFVQVDQARRACNLSLSFFEATTLAAFLIFKEQQCDVWVLEVGLGGRLDVVNIIDPDLAVITNIGLDHIDWLGDTIEKIAAEKAGIIRQNIPVIFAGEQTLPQAIVDQATQCNAPLYVVNRDYFYQAKNDYWSFSAPGMTVNLPYGKLAVHNLSTAVAAITLSGLTVTDEAIEKGIAQAYISGRFEIRKKNNQTIIFDAGHNAHGVVFLIQQLNEFLSKNSQYTEVLAVFSMLADKDIKQVVEHLKSSITHWYIAPMTVPRAADIEHIKHALKNEPYQQLDTVYNAFQTALKECQDHQVILVCGSFHTLEAVWEGID